MEHNHPTTFPFPFFPIPFPISRPSLILLLKSHRNCQMFPRFFSCELAPQGLRANIYFYKAEKFCLFHYFLTILQDGKKREIPVGKNDHFPFAFFPVTGKKQPFPFPLA